jgi:UDPglucose 6-dehydrogenase
MNITIIGTGYVGLVSGACLASIGHHVICVDTSIQRIEAIINGVAPFYEPGLEKLLHDCVVSGHLSATLDLKEAVMKSEISIIAVGTPTHDDRVDLSYIQSAVTSLAKILAEKEAYHVVVVKSTVPPGTTDSFVLPLLETFSDKKVGEFGLCMNPEFLREGCAIEDFMYPDRIVVGAIDERCGQVLSEVYKSFGCPIIHTNLRNAEMIKYTSNSLLALLISFSNEIAGLAETTAGVDIDVVMDGLHLDKRFSPVVNGERVSPGFLTYLRAGCGFGGSCFPKDVDGLRLYAQKNNVETTILDAIMTVNERRPGEIVAMIDTMVGGLKGKTIGVLGLAFKPGTDDLRESPALAAIKILLASGSNVKAYDPVAGNIARSVLDPVVEICQNPEDLFSQTNAVVIITAWPEFIQWDWKKYTGLMLSPIVIDGRNALRGKSLDASIIYRPIGCKPEKIERQYVQ